LSIQRACRVGQLGTGDCLRLADTEPIVELERDFAICSQEVNFVSGEVIRDDIDQSQATQTDARSQAWGLPCGLPLKGKESLPELRSGSHHTVTLRPEFAARNILYRWHFSTSRIKTTP